MKKLLALLIAFLPGHAKADAAKLGSDADPIRQMLFASQSLKEQVRQMHLDGSAGPFQMIADASALADAGKKAEAVARLRTVLELKQLETRIQLWVWSALRELGEKPDPKSAFEVLRAYRSLRRRVGPLPEFFWQGDILGRPGLSDQKSVSGICRFYDSIQQSGEASGQFVAATPRRSGYVADPFWDFCDYNAASVRGRRRGCTDD